MAKKKSEPGKDATPATQPKAGAKKGGTKKVKKKAAAATAAKSGTPKAAAKKKAAPKATKKAAVKKAPAVKLNDRQRDLLKKVKDAGEGGYFVGQKVEQRSIDALVDRKLLKKGAKDKAKGSIPYHLTKTGEKHLGAAPAAPAAPSA
jgi:hypothetical protein